MKAELKKLRHVLYLIAFIDIGIVYIGKSGILSTNSDKSQVKETMLEDENSADNSFDDDISLADTVENETTLQEEVEEPNTVENNTNIQTTVEIQPVNETIEVSKFYVLDTNSNEAHSIRGENDRYYLLMNNFSVYMDEENYMIYSFEDTVNKEALAQAENSNGTFHLAYLNEANDCFVDYRVENASTILIDLNQFLIENNLPNLVNESGEYNDAEMAIIQARLREINNAEMVKAKQKKYQ